MISSNPMLVFAGDLAALLLAWLVGSVVLQSLQKGSRMNALARGLGIAIIALVSLLVLRLVIPDLFGLPLVFLATAAADVVTSRQLRRNPRQPIISIMTALFVVGATVLVDATLRLFGQHLSLLAS